MVATRKTRMPTDVMAMSVVINKIFDEIEDDANQPDYEDDIRDGKRLAYYRGLQFALRTIEEEYTNQYGRGILHFFTDY